MGQPEVEPEVPQGNYEHIELEEVVARWNDILVALRQNNQSLSVILKSAKPVKSVDGVITLAFQYAFYQDRLKDATCRQIVEDVISEVFNKQLRIDTMVATNEEGVSDITEATPLNSNTETSMSDLADAFGGEVVTS